jgi:transposase
MSLQKHSFLPRQVPEDTARVGQAMLPSDSPYRQIGDRFTELFPAESEFAALYAPTGRGALSPLLLALVTVFQMWEKLPDRAAAEAVVTRINWKYARHLPLTSTGFHFTELSQCRQRLLEHEQERLLFDQFLARLHTLGLLKRRGPLRTDSPHVLALVPRLSQLELLTESVRLALRAATDLAPDGVSRARPPTFCQTDRERQNEYGLSTAQGQTRLKQAGRDGFWLLAQIEQSAPEAVRSLPEGTVLRTVLEQQFPQGGDAPPAQKRPSGGGGYRESARTPSPLRQ